MAVSLTCTSVRQQGGKVYVRWSDKAELEFASLADARQCVRDYVADAAGVRELLRVLLLAKYLKANPTGQNPGQLQGRTVVLDLDAAANLVRVS